MASAKITVIIAAMGAMVRYSLFRKALAPCLTASAMSVIALLPGSWLRTCLTRISAYRRATTPIPAANIIGSMGSDNEILVGETAI